PLLDQSRRLSERYQIRDGVAFVEAVAGPPYDKTELLLLGQERAPVAVVRDSGALTIAADFEAGFDFVKLFKLGGGMPTRVTVPEARKAEVMTKLAGVATARYPLQVNGHPAPPRRPLPAHGPRGAGALGGRRLARRAGVGGAA